MSIRRVQERIYFCEDSLIPQVRMLVILEVLRHRYPHPLIALSQDAANYSLGPHVAERASNRHIAQAKGLHSDR